MLSSPKPHDQTQPAPSLGTQTTMVLQTHNPSAYSMDCYSMQLLLMWVGQCFPTSPAVPYCFTPFSPLLLSPGFYMLLHASCLSLSLSLSLYLCLSLTLSLSVCLSLFAPFPCSPIPRIVPEVCHTLGLARTLHFVCWPCRLAMLSTPQRANPSQNSSPTSMHGLDIEAPQIILPPKELAV
jgi:hypothetical protein